MSRMILFGIVIGLLWTGQIQAQQIVGTWRFCNGPEFPGATGGIDTIVQEDGAEVVLQYDFTEGGAYAAAYCDLETPQRLDRVHFRLNKPLEATITVRVTDALGQTFQKSLYYDQSGWRNIAFNMSGWAIFWGGPKDGVLRQPVHTIGILIEKQGLTALAGALTFIGLRNEVTGESKEDMERAKPGVSPYLVTDFGKDCVLAPSVGNALRDGVWHIDFNAASSAAMSGSLSLFHRPDTLAMRLRANAPGARVAIDIGAHFQGFRRIVGTFDGTEQTFVFNLPPDGWEAYGAAHQTLHYPLRITRITVERHECEADQLEVYLKDITCDTAFDSGRAVVLVSELRETDNKQGIRGFTVRCNAWNLLDAPLSGVLVLEAKNWDGDTIYRSELPMTLSGGGRRDQVEHAFSVPASPRYVEAVCRFSSPGQQPAQTLSTFTASLTEGDHAELLPEPVRGMQPESPWGMGVYLYRNAHTRDGLADMDRIAALAAEAGVKWSREEFQFSRIETAPGVYDFSFYDDLVTAAHRHGISVYALLAYWSSFVEPYTEEGIEAFCNFTRATVRHFKDRVKCWEIYNEPNIFFWDGPKELYPVLLERCYAIVKEEDPDAEVLGISTAGIDRGFIRLVLEAAAPFDALTVHPYRSQFIERNFMRELEHVSLLVNRRPVWITEMGWSTQIGEGGKTEREQAQLLARAYLSGVGAGVRNMGWYNFRNDGADPFYNEMNFGVLHRDLTPKAAYRALATVCRIMAVKEETLPKLLPKGDGEEGLYALSTGTNTALWAPHDSLEVVVAASASAPVVLNLMGEPVPLTPLNDMSSLPRRNRRSQRDVSHYRISLPKGDPLFLLNSPVTIVRVDDAGETHHDPEILLF